MDSVRTYNAAMATRLAAPFGHKNAAVYGDSRFGSVKAAYYVWTIHRTHTVWDIKTATALFPRKELQRLCPKEHGAVIVMTAKINTELKAQGLEESTGVTVTVDAAKTGAAAQCTASNTALVLATAAVSSAISTVSSG